MDPVWDAENRLIQVTPRNPSGKETRNRDVHFEYDYMSRRIRKYTYAWSGTAWGTSIAEDTRFVYDGWNVVQEIDGLSPGTTGTTDVIRNYTWGLDLSGQSGNPSVGGIHGAGGIGGLLATHWTKGTTSTSDDSKYVYFYDANGNVGQMMDVVSTSSGYGTIAAQYEYYPFGGLLDAQGVAAEGNPFRFSTKYRDNEDGSYYYGYRYLRTKHGRWLSRDPIEEAGGLLLYEYCGNSAIASIDPLGDDWLNDLSNFVAGVGDSLSFGMTGVARKAIFWATTDEWEDGVDTDSAEYVTGEHTEIGVEILVSAGGATLRHIASKSTGKAARRALEGNAISSFRRAKSARGGFIHHVNPIRGHPGNIPARFPMPFRFAAQGFWNMEHVATKTRHLQLHRTMRKLEALDRLREGTILMRQGTNRVVNYLNAKLGCGCWNSVDIFVNVQAERVLNTISIQQVLEPLPYELTSDSASMESITQVYKCHVQN